ncbi:uncharacterized protein [Miscanthus floridulus]|uniref:uncharacterized protein isoform X2 n=1 Tax=Miscanthus floridulus TaxID=154761 RepID=UPI003459BC6A
MSKCRLVICQSTQMPLHRLDVAVQIKVSKHLNVSLVGATQKREMPNMDLQGEHSLTISLPIRIDTYCLIPMLICFLCSSRVESSLRLIWILQLPCLPDHYCLGRPKCRHGDAAGAAAGHGTAVAARNPPSIPLSRDFSSRMRIGIPTYFVATLFIWCLFSYFNDLRLCQQDDSKEIQNYLIHSRNMKKVAGYLKGSFLVYWTVDVL